MSQLRQGSCQSHVHQSSLLIGCPGWSKGNSLRAIRLHSSVPWVTNWSSVTYNVLFCPFVNGKSKRTTRRWKNKEMFILCSKLGADWKPFSKYCLFNKQSKRLLWRTFIHIPVENIHNHIRRQTHTLAGSVEATLFKIVSIQKMTDWMFLCRETRGMMRQI